MKKLLTLMVLSILSISGFGQCTASFTASINGNTVTFNNTSSVTSGASYYWTFSSGGSSYAPSPTVQFTSNGAYLVCLNVSDSTTNCFDTYCDTIVITGNPCNADFSLSSSTGTISGTNLSSGGFSYEWYVYDNTWNQVHNSTSFNLSYTTSQNGSYYVCLYVNDSSGYFCDSSCSYVNVTNVNQPCTASFNLAQAQGTLQGTNTSTGTFGSFWNIYNSSGATVYSATTNNFTYNTGTNGQYLVCLVGLDSSGYPCDSFCSSIYVNGNGSTGCQANFTVYTNIGNYVAFGNLSSPLAYGIDYWWDFGDGTAGNSMDIGQADTSHVYPGPGVYIVCLTVIDSINGCSDTYCDSIVISSQAGCNVNMALSQSLNAIQGTNNSTGASSYEWFVYDNTWNQVFTTTATSLYYQPSSSGVYNICLYAYDNMGMWCDSTCSSINFSSSACDPTFGAVDSLGSIHFYPNTFSPSITYSWNFGDGTFATGPYPTHTYASPGAYAVCLTIADSAVGCFATYCDSVLVQGQTGCNVSMVLSQSPGVIHGTNNSTGASSYQWYVMDNLWNQVYTTTANTLYYQPSANGVYHVCLYAYDNMGMWCDSTCSSINFNSLSTCDPTFTWLDTNGNGDVYFIPNTYSPNYDYFWDFGDGNNGYGPFPNNIYSSPGMYLVCLTVTDSSAGCSSVYCDTINVSGSANPCSASFWSVDSANYVYFINTSSGSNLNYFWDFGDGNSSTQTNPGHSYNAPGTYTACLTVWNSTCVDTFCYAVTVTNPTTCSSNFVWFLDSTFNTGSPNTVYIFNLAQGSNLTYNWDFGDGNSSSLAYPTHTYAQNGIYAVCLTVSDGTGCVDTYCDSIEYVQRQSGFTINILPMSSFGSVEVEEQSVEISSVYPNPTSDQLIVEMFAANSNDLNLEVTDMLGKTVMSQSVSNRGDFKLNLNVGHLENGIYMLVIKSEKGQSITRFMKQ